VDFLVEAGQTWWQMLPVGVPYVDGSPYNSISSRAGSPYLISLEDLAEAGALTREEVAAPPAVASKTRVDFPVMMEYRERALRRAYERVVSGRQRLRGEFDRFVAEHTGWLDDFALYGVLRERSGGKSWEKWDEELRLRKPRALRRAMDELRREVDYHRFVQFAFDRQWQALRRYANARGVGLIGDIPIFVAHDSVDVWCNQELFELEKNGRPRRVTGVPPDMFCATGQRWGHPQYNWSAHERSGFSWWVDRLAGAFRLFDAMRIDHFLGFRRVWSIAARSKTAQRGRWVRSPGEALFGAVERKLGKRPIIAEDLGLLTPEAACLRDECGMPGMRVLQFGFGAGGGDPYHRPHSFVRSCVAYTGTHDNSTAVGWFNSLDAAERKRFFDYAGDGDPGAPHQAMIRLAMSSVANTAIFPVQDVLGLDDAARMNTPGTITGNWGWRVAPGALNEEVAGELRRRVELFDRAPPGRMTRAGRTGRGDLDDAGDLGAEV
jgi:4-alpha-glucanotransferase